MEEYINKRATLNEKVALYRLKCVKSLISFSIRFLFKGFKNFVFRIISNEAQENLTGKENVLFIQSHIKGSYGADSAGIFEHKPLYIQLPIALICSCFS